MQVILIRSFTSDTDFLRMRTRNSFALKQACAGHYVPPNLLSEKKAGSPSILFELESSEVD